MAIPYEHSRVFDQMKLHKERITTNYTSLQYLQTLDYFLWSALKSIALDCPLLYTNYMAKVVARQLLRPSAKFASDGKDSLALAFFNMMTQDSDLKMFEASKALHLNRGLLFGLISVFLKQTTRYAYMHRHGISNLAALTAIENRVGLIDGANLYHAVQQVIYWDTRARLWKSLIAEKYTRMAIMQAQKAYTDFNHSVDLDDCVLIYLCMVNRAIDRCDPRLGVLTTFIASWLKSARSEVFRLAESQQDLSYESLVEDHGDAASDILGTSNPDFSAELNAHIAYIARQVDPDGLVRTSLGIEQHISRSQRQLLEELAI